MLHTRRLLAALTLTAAVLAGCESADGPSTAAPSPSRPASGFEVGQPFPAVAFPALDGGAPRSIADFRGEKLILHVFASW